MYLYTLKEITLGHFKHISILSDVVLNKTCVHCRMAMHICVCTIIYIYIFMDGTPPPKEKSTMFFLNWYFQCFNHIFDICVLGWNLKSKWIPYIYIYIYIHVETIHMTTSLHVPSGSPSMDCRRDSYRQTLCFRVQSPETCGLTRTVSCILATRKKSFHAIRWNTPYLLKDLHLKENTKDNQTGRLLGGGWHICIYIYMCVCVCVLNQYMLYAVNV